MYVDVRRKHMNIRNGTRYASYHGRDLRAEKELPQRTSSPAYNLIALINSPRQITLLALETFLHQHDRQSGIPPLVGPPILAVAIVIGPEHEVLRHLHDAPLLRPGIF